MNILITGKPRSGKTTLIKEILPRLRKACGFFTEEIQEDNSRSGFKIKTLSGEEFILAKQGLDSSIKVSKYGVDLKGLEKALDLVEREAGGSDIVVIDEIGKMEWSSLKFREFIYGVLESGKVMIATIAEKEYRGLEAGVGDFSKIKGRKGVALFRLSRDNFTDIHARVLLARDCLPRDALRILDSKAKDILGIPENILIENASRGILEALKEENILPRCACIFAGRGNNGADSLALARHLLNRNVDLDVFLVLNGGSCNKEVQFQLQILEKIIDKRRIKTLNNKEDLISLVTDIKSKDLIIDGMFGIGFRPPLDSFYKDLFVVINNNSRKTIAVDIPSGLSADDGLVDETAIRADTTVTFVSPKIGFFTGEGPEYTGKILVKDIGISPDALKKL